MLIHAGRVFGLTATRADDGRWRHDAVAWTLEIEKPKQVEAMVSTPDALFVAGPASREAPNGKGFLRAIDPATGEIRARIDLPSPPVHDGLAAAHGRIVAVLRDVRIVCLTR